MKTMSQRMIVLGITGMIFVGCSGGPTDDP